MWKKGRASDVLQWKLWAQEAVGGLTGSEASMLSVWGAYLAFSD